MMQGIQAEHISTLRLVNLHKYKLHIFFDFVPQTLADFLNRTGDLNGGIPLKPRHTANLLFQLLDGVAYCHRRGVLHRNLKPKHLLVVAGPDPSDPLEGATLKVRASHACINDVHSRCLTFFPPLLFRSIVVRLRLGAHDELPSSYLHDGGGDTVVPASGDPHGLASLLCCCRHVVSRVYLCRDGAWSPYLHRH